MSVRQKVYEKYVPILLENKILDVIGCDQLVGLHDVPQLGVDMLAGRTKGRYVIEMDKH